MSQKETKIVSLPYYKVNGKFSMILGISSKPQSRVLIKRYLSLALLIFQNIQLKSHMYNTLYNH